MTTKLKEVDVLLVGLGWTGGILAKELTAAGHKVVAVQLDTSFRRMLPLGTDALLEAWVESVDGRKVRTAGRSHRSSGIAKS